METNWELSFVSSGEWAITDVTTDCQVGWITKSTGTSDWYIRGCAYDRVGGPFPSKKAASAEIENLLKGAFGSRRSGN